MKYTGFYGRIILAALMTLGLVGCDYGYTIIDFIGSLDEPEIPPEQIQQANFKEAFLGMEQCLDAHFVQQQNSSVVLDKLVSINCFDQERAKIVRSLSEDITKLIEEIKQRNSLVDENKLTKEEITEAINKMSALSEKYDELQNMFARCRVTQFVDHTPISKQITEEKPGRSGSLLLHTVGDVFAPNAGENFEGNVSVNTLQHRLGYLKSIRSVLAKNTFIKDIAQANPCNGIAKLPFKPTVKTQPDFSLASLDKFIDKNEISLKLSENVARNELKTLRTNFAEELGKLTVTGDSIFITSNWTKHAFVYQFIKEDKPNSFSFRMYNSGQGIGAYHAETIKGFEIQFVPFVEVSELTKEKLLSHVFLQSLVEISNPINNSEPSDFYERVFFELGGKPSKAIYEATQFKAPQQGGTCSYFSQPWVMEAAFDQMQKNGIIAQENFFPHRLELLFGLKTLRDYSKKLNKDNGNDLSRATSERLTLLEKSIVFLSSQLLDASRLGAIGPGEMSAALATEEPLHVDVKEAMAKKHVAPATVPLDASAALPANVNENLGQQLNVALPINAAPGRVNRSSLVLDAANLNLGADSAAVINSLREIAANLEAARLRFNFSQIINFVEVLATKLPLSQAFWNGLAANDAENLIAYLKDIQSNFVFSLLKSIGRGERPAKRIVAKEFLSALKIFALADLINRHSNIPAENKLPSLYQPRFSDLLYKDNAIIELQGASNQKLLKELREYFSPYKNFSSSFFQFELIPAGFQTEKLPPRRVMFDPKAEIPIHETHWSDKKIWSDVDWAVRWIKRQPTYANWLVDEERDSRDPGNDKYIYPFTYSIDGYYYGRGFEYWQYESPAMKPTMPRYQTEIVDRREALKQLANVNTRNGDFDLPPTFFALRQMSYEMDFLLTGDLSGGRYYEFLPFGLEYKDIQLYQNKYISEKQRVDDNYEHEYKQIGRDWDYVWKRVPKDFSLIQQTTFKGANISHSIFGSRPSSYFLSGYDDNTGELKELTGAGKHVSEYLHLQNGVIPFEKYSTHDENTKFDIDHLMRIYSTGVKNDSSGKPILDPQVLQERRRLLPNDLILFDPVKDDLQKLTLERIRGVFTLSGVKQFQLVETLALFSEYSSLLTREEYQRIFEKLMLEPRLFLDQLQISELESKQFIDKITEFCKKQYQSFEQVGNVKGIAFILRMNQLFKLQTQYALTHGAAEDFKVAPTILDGFMDSPSLLFSNAINPELSAAQKALLYVNLAGAFVYVNEFTDDDMAYMLLARIKYQTLGVKDTKWEDKFVQGEITDLLSIKQSQIQQIFNDPGRRRDILNFVAQQMRPDLVGLPEWNAPGPAVAVNRKPVVFAADFGGRLISIDVMSANLTEAGQHEVSTPFNASDIEKALGKVGIPETVTQIGYNRYQWINAATRIEYRVERAGATWIFQKNDADGNWYQYMDERALAPFKDQRGFFSDLDHWQEVGNDDPKILVLDPVTKNRLYTTQLANHGNEVSEIVRVADNLHLALLPANNNVVRRFTAIESPRHIEIWKNAADRIVEIALPRLGFVFKPLPTDATKLDCGHFTKHRLAENQFAKSIPGPVNYLVCEPRDGETVARIALMPLAKIRGEEDLPSLSSNYDIDRTHGKTILLTYELPRDDDPSASLKPADDAAVYYLALRKWWSHDYLAARKLLLSGDFEVSRLSKAKGEVDALEWLLGGREKVGDKEIQDLDPRATAVRLLAAAILIGQNQDYGNVPSVTEKENVKMIAELYSNHLRNLHLIGSSWLDFYSEWTIASFVDAQGFNDLNFSNRIKILKFLHPSRFLNETLTKKFRTDVKERRGTRREYAKATNNITTIDELRQIRNQTILGMGHLGNLSVLGEAKRVFIKQHFGLLYNIAAKKPFDKDEAIAVLKAILASSTQRDELDLTSLSEEEIRQEFTFLFKTTALYLTKAGEAPENKLARTLELITQAQGPLLSWSEIVDLLDKQQAAEQAWLAVPPGDAERQSRAWQKNYDLQEQIRQSVLNPIKEAATEVCFAPQIKPKDIEAKDVLRSVAREAVQDDSAIFAHLVLHDPMKEPYLDKDRFDEIFSVDDISAAASALITDDAQTLIAALDPGAGASAPDNLKTRLTELHEKIKAYKDKEIAQAKTFGIKDWTSLNLLRDEIIEKIDQAKKEKDGYHEEAIRIVTKQKSAESSALYTRMARLAQVEATPKIDDLIYLLLTRKIDALQAVTVEKVDKKALKDVVNNLVGYLLQSTYGQYLEECKKALDDLVAVNAAGGDISAPAKRAANILQEKRRYNFETRIEYLVFEHFVELHIRELQVAALEKLDIKNGEIRNTRALGQVLEMIMGFGKTSVLLPLISAMNTGGEWLNVVMLPESLVASMSRELRKNIRKSFNRSVQVIEVNRQTKLDEMALNLLYDRLVRARNEGTTIVTTNSSVQSLFLSYIDRLYRYEKFRHQVDNEITQFVKIFQFLRQYGTLTIDEVDMALDVLKAHQFSVGDRIPINETLTASLFSFYRKLLTTPALHNNLKLPFISFSKGEALSREKYDAFIPNIVQAIVSDKDFFEGYSNLNKAYGMFLSGANGANNQQLLANYLNNLNASNNRTLLFKAIDDQFKGDTGPARNNRELLKNMASVLYEEINQTFFLTASKKLGVHYGALPAPTRLEDESEQDFKRRYTSYENSKFISIPYHAGQPAVNSRFGTPMEAVNYTIQQGIEERNFGFQVNMEIDTLKVMSSKATDPVRINEVQTRFNTLNSLLTPPVRSILGITEEHVERITAKLHDDANILAGMDLIKNYTIPQLKTYAVQLHTNGQIYGSLFKMVSGFSGTLWSANTFPSIFKTAETSDTEEKTFLLLWREYRRRQRESLGTYRAVREVVEPAPDPDRIAYLSGLLNDVYDDWANPGSLLEQSGLLRGFNNLDVARIIAGKLAVDSGAVYYDDNDQIAVYQNGSNITVPLDSTTVPQNNRVAYWDKKHTTGSDLKLNPRMTARMTFDHHTFSRDLQQTVWRLRGLADEQRIDKYLVLPADLELIKMRMVEILKSPRANFENFDLGQLLLYVKINQEVRLGDLLHRSLKHKMSNAIASEALGKMLENGVSNERAAEIYRSFSTLFERKLDKQPYQYMGFPVAMAPAETVLIEDENKLFTTSIKQALTNMFSTVTDFVGSLKKRIGEMIDAVRGLLPEKLTSSAMESGLEVEIELEQELEQEQEQETEREIEQHHFDQNYVPHPVLQWGNADQFFAANYFDQPANLNSVGPVLNTEIANGTTKPFFVIKDALQLEKNNRYATLAALLDERILGSLNFAPVQHRNNDIPGQPPRYEFSFFGLYQKAITSVLVILEDTGDDQTAPVKIMAIDNNDAAQFEQILIDDINNPVGPHDKKIALYSLEQGLFRQGSNRIDAERLEQNENFVTLMAQLKFLNGSVFYSPSQLAKLKDWILTAPDPEYMFRVFKSSILIYKQDGRDQMQNSDIGRLFESLAIY